MAVPRAAAARGVFVTGTDTGVGKTLIACALLRAWTARGARAVGMKPVAAGAVRRAGAWRNGDVERLLAAGNVAAPRRLVNPYCFAPPIAPHIAARLAAQSIRLERIERAYRALAVRADVVVVEGAGGFCVPLGPRASFADVPRRLGLPVVLVVGMRLGCLNHALLTAEAVRARGLVLAGWVANHVDARMRRAEENVATLARLLGAPLLARVGHAARPDARRIARVVDIDALRWR
jgi:dethiobiotin synthetase